MRRRLPIADTLADLVVDDVHEDGAVLVALEEEGQSDSLSVSFTLLGGTIKQLTFSRPQSKAPTTPVEHHNTTNSEKSE